MNPLYLHSFHDAGHHQKTGSIKACLIMFLSLFFLFPRIYANPAPLNGTYQLGSGHDYTSLTQAFDSLNTHGVSGPVVFELVDETYNLDTNLHINDASGTMGTSKTNTVTFKPANGITPVISINNKTYDYGIKINEVDYIIFDGSNNGTDSRDMEIRLTGTATNAAVFYITDMQMQMNGASNVTIKNCIITNNTNTNTSNSKGIYAPVEETDSLSIINNWIRYANEGINISGNMYDNLEINVLNNEIGHSVTDSSITNCGINIYSLSMSSNTNVIGNTVYNLSVNTASERIGIKTSGSKNVTINKNIIRDIVLPSGYSQYVTSGIYIDNSYADPGILITNNFIFHIAQQGYSTDPADENPAGITILNSYSPMDAGAIKIYNNSIYLTPDAANGLNSSGGFSAGLLINNSSNGYNYIDFQNNIIQNSLGKKSGSGFSSTGYAICDRSGSNSFSTIDYNIYYVTNHDYNVMGYITSTTYQLFSNWQSSVRVDYNSYFQDPKFISQTDLHIQAGEAVEGKNISSVSKDIDNEPRVYYHIGADEHVTVTVVQADTISTNTIWSDDVVQVFGDVVIDNGVTLTIEPGVLVEFQDSFNIIVQGSINATGTPEDSIFFVSSDTTGFAALTYLGWGITFDSTSNTNDSSLFSYCHFEFGGGQSDLNGGAIYVDNFNKIEITNCKFIYNGSTVGGAVCAQNSSFEIKNSVFSNNYSSTGGAIAQSYGKLKILSNLICNNQACRGGGIFISQDDTTMVFNNTIVNNYAETKCGSQEAVGGGVRLDILPEARFYNNIIYGNDAYSQGQQVAIGMAMSSPTFYYNNIEGGESGIEGQGTYHYMDGNIDMPPQFINPSPSYGINYPGYSYNWKLTSSSPCINAGNYNWTTDSIGVTVDLAGKPRIFADTVDMGAYENRTLSGSGYIYGEVIWDADTVYVTDTIFIMDTLIIKPGVVVAVDPYNAQMNSFPVIIHGYLEAKGNQQDTIKFMSTENWNSWGGLHFESDADPNSSLEYVHLDNYYMGMKPTISIKGTTINYSNNLVVLSEAGFVLDSTNQQFINETFDYSLTTNFVIKNSSNVLFKNCTFNYLDNGEGSGGMGLFNVDSASLTIDSCYFDDVDEIYTGGSWDIDNRNTDTVIIRNSTFEKTSFTFNLNSYNDGPVIITNNKFYSVNSTIITAQADTAYFTNNLIYYDKNSSPFHHISISDDNNTGIRSGVINFYNNTAYMANSSYNDDWIELYEYSGGNPVFNCKNSVIWGFGGNTISTFGNYTLNIDYSNFPAYADSGAGNVEIYPEFIDTSAAIPDLSISSNSVCINNGQPDFTLESLFSDKDLANNPRIFNGLPVSDIIDIGAYEYQGEPTLLYVSDTIKTNTTWDVDTVYIIDTVVVAPGVTLTINSGVNVMVYDSEALIVKGELDVYGTSVDTVKFVPENQVEGSWNGIVFQYASSASEINYALVNIGLGSISSSLYFYNSDITLNNITLTETYSPIQCNYSDIAIDSSNFIFGDMDISGSFNFKYCSDVSVTNSLFKVKGYFDYDMLDIDSSEITFDNCVFKDEYGYNYNWANITNTINDTVFFQNSAFDSTTALYHSQYNNGVLVLTHNKFKNPDQIIDNQSGKVDFMNNEVYFETDFANTSSKIIAENNGGADTSSVVDFFNNTVYNANQTQSFKMLYAYDMPHKGAIINCKNSIIHGRFTADPISQLGDGIINVSYSNIQLYSGGGTANLDTFPAFVDTNQAALDLSLMDTSACINAGKPDFTLDSLYYDTDLAGNLRINGTIIDIGAYEYQQLLQPQLSLEKDTLWFKDTIFIESVDTISFWVYNTGTDTLIISNIAINPPFDDDFGMGDTILAGDSLLLDVFLHLDTIGIFEDSMILYTNAADTSIYLYGNISPVPANDIICGQDSIQDMDGNWYQTVAIGGQCWIAENLATTRYHNGTAIPKVENSTDWSNLTETDPAYCWYDNDSTGNGKTYGALYTWTAAMNSAESSDSVPSGIQGVCPDGWHVPSDNELKELEVFLGMDQAELDNTNWRGTNQGSKLAGNANLWSDGNLESDSEFGSSGFKAVPGGYRAQSDGSYNYLGTNGSFWSSTEESTSTSWNREIAYVTSNVNRNYYYKNTGFSVRCVADSIVPYSKIEVSEDTLIFDTLITQIGEDTLSFWIYNTGNDTLFIDSVSILNAPFYDTYASNPILAGDSVLFETILNLDTVGVFESNLKLFTQNFNDTSTLIIKAIVKPQPASDIICGTDSIQDYDGNWYQTVAIGGQCWMAENIKTTTYPDGNSIPKVSASADWDNLTENDPGYCWYDNDSSTNFKIYGALYNWAAGMKNASSSNSNPSGVQGVCPDGWHIPSYTEWDELENYLTLDGNEGNEGRVLKTDNGWDSGGNGTDLYGFNAVPGGYRLDYGAFTANGLNGYWLTSSETSSTAIYTRNLYSVDSLIIDGNHLKEVAYSIRCVADSVVSYSFLKILIDTLDFGTQVSAAEKDTLSFWIYNKGNDTLLIDSISPDKPPYTYLIGNTFILPEDSTYMDVVLNKDTSGVFEETLHIYSNAKDDSVMVLAELQSLTPPGNTLTFNGTNGYVDLNEDMASIEGYSQGTIMGWFRTDTASTQMIFSINSNTMYYMGVGINNLPYVNDSAAFSFKCDGDTYYDMSVNREFGYYSDNLWHHFAVVIDGVDNRIYIDGDKEEVTGGTTTNQFTDIWNGTDLYSMSIGAYMPSANKKYFDGQLDELSVWDHPLTEDSVLMYMHQSLDGTEPGLLAYYDFDQVAGTTLPDLSPSNADGIVTNLTDADWQQSKALITPFIDSLVIEGNDIFSVYWDSVPGVKNYKYAYYEDPCEGCIISHTPYSNNSYTASGLVPGTKYIFEVYSEMAGGLTSDSEFESAIMPMDMPGNALNFQGDSQYVEVPYVAELNPSEFTITAWVKPSRVDSVENILGTLNSNDYTGYNLYNNAGSWMFALGTGSATEGVSSTAVVKTGQWTHLAGTYDGTEMKLYVNGLVQDSLTTSYTLNTLRPLTFAKHSLNDAYYFLGGMDEVALYDTALSGKDIHDRLHKQLDVENEPNLVAYYNFNRNAGAELHDLSVRDKAGTLYGMGDSNWKSSGAMIIPFARKATNVSDMSFVAHWDTIPGAMYYVFEAARDSLFADLVDSLDVGNTGEYTVNGLSPDSVYYYRVKAYLPDLVSDWSNRMKVETISGNTAPVAIDDNVALCENDSIIIDVQANDSDADMDMLETIIISNPLYGTIDILNNDSIQYIPAKSYFGNDTIVYQVYDGTTYDTAKVFITVNPVPVIALGNDTSICEGDSIILDAGPGNIMYAWGFGATEQIITVDKSGIYDVTVMDGNGCGNSDTIQIFMNTVDSIYDYAEICEGSDYLGYDSAGIYYENYTNQYGCDSIIEIEVVVNYPDSTYLYGEICQGSNFMGYDSSGTYYENYTNQYGCDSIVEIEVVVTDTITSTVDTSICQGDTYTLPGGGIVSTAGTYVDSLVSVEGCDSIVTTNLAVHDIDSTYDYAEICEGKDYRGYDSAGVYYEYFTNALGCDSVVEIEIVVHTSDSVYDYMEICEGESYKGYSSSGIYYENLINQYGCDSIVEIDLVVNPVDTIYDYAEICEGSDYLGYDSAGIYYENYTNQYGCDSIIEIEIVVNYPDSTYLYGEICQGSNFMGYDSSGTYYENYTNQYGCDSIVEIEVVVTDTITSTVDASICQGESYTLPGGGIVSTAGSYVDSLVSVEGCDSIVTTNLAVHDIDSTYDYAEICEGKDYRGYDSAGVYYEYYTNAFGCDSVVEIEIVVHTSDSVYDYMEICEGESYKGYSSSGIYYENLANQYGCDSIVEIDLVVNPIDTVYDYAEICEGGDYLGYDSAGVYYENYMNQYGCDSIIEIEIVVNYPDSTYLYGEVCQGSNFMGYDSSGTYYENYTNQYGCDSIVEIEVVVTDTITSTVDASICQGESYTLPGGGIVSTAGTYVDSLVSAEGCDSIVTTNLTVLPAYDTTITKTICEGESFMGYTSTGMYTDSLSTVNGCDSVVHVDLTVTPTITNSVNPAICQGESYNGHTVSGIYEDTLTAVSTGCDSIVTTNLTVLPAYDTTITKTVCEGESFMGYTSTGMYTDSLSTVNGCDSVVHVDLTVTPLPLADAGYDTTINYNSTATLNGSASGGSGSYLYNWSPADSLTDATIPNPETVILTSSNTFTLIVTDAVTGCSGTDEMDVLVAGGSLSITSTSVFPETVCQGEEVLLSVLVSGGAGNYYYTWKSVAMDSVLNEGVDLNNINVLPQASATYRVIVSDGSEKDSAELSVNVNNLPAVSITGNHLVCEGSEASFTASGANTYLWSTGHATENIAFTAMTSQTIYVTGTDVNGCEDSDSIDIEVLVIDSINITKTICEGDGYNGHISSGIYTDTYTAANGCDSVVTVDLTVIPTIVTPVTISICEGESYNGHRETGIYSDTLLSAAGCDSVVELDLTVLDADTTIISAEICEGESFRGYDAPGRFVEHYTKLENGCDSILFIDITMHPLPLANAGEDKTIVQGDSVLLRASGGQTYQWLANDSIERTDTAVTLAYPNQSTNYVVTVTDEFGCASTDSVFITVKEPLEEQVISMTEGWNIMSMNIQPGSHAMLDIVQPLIDNNQLVQVQDESGNQVVNLAGNWYDFIPMHKNTEGYLVRVNQNGDLTINGINFQEPVIVNLKKGWNIISYAEKSAKNSEEVLAPLLTGNYLRKAQDEAGAAIEFIDPVGWVNNIGDFEPGEGYKVRVSATSYLFYGVQKKSHVVTTDHELKTKSRERHFSPVWEGNGYNHMCFYIEKAKIEGNPIEVGDEIAVFDGQKCVGVTRFTGYVNGFIPLKASKDDPSTTEADGFVQGNQVGFQIWDASEETYIKQVSISNLVDKQNPPEMTFMEYGAVILSLEGKAEPTDIHRYHELITGFGNVYPNPFSENLTINYIIADQQDVNMAVYNLLGQKVKILVDDIVHPGEYQIQWNREDNKNDMVRPGIYLLRLKSGLYAETIRITVE